MRSNKASAPCTSTCTLSSCPSGKKSRLWRVVKATMSPTVGAVAAFWMVSTPASQYTKAGRMLKTVPTIMKNQRPTMLWRMASTASLALAALKRSIEARCWPNVLESRMPLTLSVSWVMAETSAMLFWVSPLMPRRTLPTR